MAENRPRAVVVEDNPVTRKLIVVTLEAAGFGVYDAADGATALELIASVTPQVVVQDYVLPDMNGDELLARIRSAESAVSIPVILLTGLTAKTHAAGTTGFAALLTKPVEPSRLLQHVHAVLRGDPEPAAPSPGTHLVLVIDDLPLNRKLTALRLEHAGFEVVTADSVEAGLAAARARRPGAILADVLMPGLDGFQLCLAVRRDPALASIPIVLVSSAYREREDRELALDAGASDLLASTPNMQQAVTSLRAAIAIGARPLAESSRGFGQKYLDTLRRQVSSQLAVTRELSERSAIQSSALSLLSAMSQLLSRPSDLTHVLGDVLVHCLDASGLSTGVLYTVEADGRSRLHSANGLSVAGRQAAEHAFGIPDVLFGRDDAPRAYSERSATADERRLLDGLGHPTALVVPFVMLGRNFGTLVLASQHHALASDAWLTFARALALQFAQVIALGQSLARLAETANRVQTLMDHANDAIAALTPNGVIRDVNRRLIELLGRPEETLIGRHFSEFLPPTETANVDAFYVVAREGHGTVRDIQMLRSDGSIVVVDFSMSTIAINEEQLVLAIGHDVTEHRRLEQQFFQAQKMEAVGRLAGGVAHDFNNILTAILGHSELILEDAPPHSPLHENISEVISAGQRATGLTRQLLAFSRQQVIQPQVAAPNVLIAELEKLLRRLIGEDVEMETRLASTRNIVIDSGQFEQILLNLAVNARDAMPQGGRLVIETSDVTVGPDPSAGGPPPGDYVRVRVSDTGVGIPPDIIGRIFEPFFTTKEAGRGTGLGLSTVYGIVQQAHGLIHVCSEPGSGACFTIDFPAVAAEVVRKPVAATPPPAPGGATILLAEDDVALRTLATRVLERAGYKVLGVGNAAAAVAVAHARGTEIALLITDVIMPGGNGKELADRLVAAQPGLRVLFTSGYTADIVGEHGVIDSGTAYLPKPFTPTDLCERVRQVLEAA